MSRALEDIAAERQRQMDVEGWTPEHDDTHTKGEMASAASAYAAASTLYHADPYAGVLSIWPWSRDCLKPTTPRRDLVKAGALIVAEIERLDRVATSRDGQLSPHRGTGKPGKKKLPLAIAKHPRRSSSTKP